MSTIDKKLQALLDKQDIYEALMTYCRAIDRHDWELLESVYHDDAIDDHGLYQGSASGFIEFLKGFLSSIEITSHNITNCLIELKSDTQAFCESYVIAGHWYEEDGESLELVVGGRFLDQFEKRDGQWRIAKRQLVTDWNSCSPATARWEGPIFESFRPRGSKGRNDPLYTMGS